MNALPPCLALLGFTLLLHVALRRRVELALCAAVSTVILLLYVGGWVGSLRAFRMALLVAGDLACTVSVVLLVVSRSFRIRCRDVLSPGMAFFLLALAAGCLTQSDVRVHQWDEIGLWAMAPKYLAATHELYRPGGAIYLPDYPPGEPLWHYFFLALGPFSEGRLYFSQAILILAPLALVVGRLSWRRPEWVVLLVACLLLFGSVLDFDESPSLCADLPIAVWFTACVVLCTMPLGTEGSRERLCLAAMTGTLPLLKEIGLFFAAVVLGMTALHGAVGWLVRRREGFRPSRPAWWSSLAVVGVVALCQGSWSLRNRALQATPTYSLTHFGWREVVNALRGHGTDRQEWLRREFHRVAVGLPITTANDAGRLVRRVLDLPRPTTPAWVVIFILISSLAVTLTRDAAGRRAVIVTSFTLLVGLAAYLLLLLVLYMFSFAAEDAAAMAGSFGRYVFAYLLPMMLVPSAWLAKELSERAVSDPSRRLALASYACLPLVALYVCETPTLAFTRKVAVPEERAWVEGVLGRVLKDVPRDSTISLICPHTRGLEYFILRYEAYPRSVTGPWSLGKPYESTDVWTQQVSPTEWRRLLVSAGVSYLVVLNPDERFWSEYGGLFSLARRPDDFLFRVRRIPVDAPFEPVQ